MLCGETDAPFRCEHCSNCSTDFEVLDATVDAQKVMSCVLRLAQRGRSMGKASIVNILHGSRAKSLLDAHLDELSTYGIMADMSTQRIRYVLDALVDAGHLAVSEGSYPVISATQQGLEFLRERCTFELKVPRRLSRADAGADATGAALGPGRRSTGADAGSSADLAPVDEVLFERLRALRTRLAAEAKLPAYMVFSNATLTDMCRKMPLTADEPLEVSGVGEAKAARYGEEFLACIAAYVDERRDR